jgi:hypothetical protein
VNICPPIFNIPERAAPVFAGTMKGTLIFTILLPKIWLPPILFEMIKEPVGIV